MEAGVESEAGTSTLTVKVAGVAITKEEAEGTSPAAVAKAVYQSAGVEPWSIAYKDLASLMTDCKVVAAEASLDLVITPAKVGIAIAARIPSTTMTTISSRRVKPRLADLRWLEIKLVKNLLIVEGVLVVWLEPTRWWGASY